MGEETGRDGKRGSKGRREGVISEGDLGEKRMQGDGEGMKKG